MAVDPYQSCPCGSGKKFKWCCQDIYADIDEVFRLDVAGQHEVALQKMADVVARHAGNPEVHGRYAHLLSIQGKQDEAEKALDRAFAINPNYPFGHLLRGQFRFAVGDFPAAADHLHKAADLYAPDARGPLRAVHELIAEVEFRLNRPIAAKAALKRAIQFDTGDEELKQAYEQAFGPKSRLPASVRKDYKFERPAKASANWDRALTDAATGRLSDVQRVFELWTKKYPDDPAAWFNLGLVNAWLGENAAAVEALAQYVEREPDENRSAEAWTLAEVLRCGHGLEDDADWVEHRAVYVLRDVQPLIAWLQELEQGHRLIGLSSNPEAGILSALLLEEVSSLVLSGAAAPPAKLAAYLTIAGHMMQLWHPVKESLDKVVADIQSRFGAEFSEPMRAVGPIHFGDVVAEAMLFPTASTTQLDAEAKIRSHAQQFFEETWPHRPLKSLLGVPPIDASGHRTLRKRLRGTVQFLEDCAAQTSIRLYDFNRLRHKLGLDGAMPAAVVTAPTEARDFSAMSAADLGGLDVAALGDSELEQAFRTAQQLDAGDLAGRFAQALVDRPVPEGGADRHVYFHHLIAAAQANRDFDAALNLVDAGEKADCEGNEGQRRNEYELKRGQLLAKRGDAAAALEVLDRLVARAPDDLSIVGSATEAMLSAKQPAAAQRFAETGLARAREQNNRDLEGYFSELLEAARRQGG